MNHLDICAVVVRSVPVFQVRVGPDRGAEPVAERIQRPLLYLCEALQRICTVQGCVTPRGGWFHKRILGSGWKGMLAKTLRDVLDGKAVGPRECH